MSNETSADVYRLLTTIHEQLERFESVQIGELKASARSLSDQVTRIEAQLQRIEQRVNQR